MISQAGAVLVAQSLLALTSACAMAPVPAAELPGHTRNVILVTLDGVRTQEIFGGLDETIAPPRSTPTGTSSARSQAESPQDWARRN